MKVIFDRGALVESLTLIRGVVPARTPKPVLTCVKISAKDGNLTLSATDLEAAVRVSTPRVEVQEPGEVLVPADKLDQIVRESVDPTLTLSVEGDATHIRGQDSRFKVFGYPVAEFPPIPEFKGEADFEIPAGELNQLVNQTAFASAKENSRYAMNGVLVEREGNKLTLVATDGHRLALARGGCKAGKDQPAAIARAIVPTRALHLLQRTLANPEQSVKVKVADNQVLFATETTLLVSNLIEGNFPPYKDVIPKDGDKKATLATDQLTSAVRRASLLTNEESRGVRMSFKKEGLTISSRAPEMGEAEINVDLPKYEGEPIEIGFNPSYVLDALKVLPSDHVTLEFKAGNKPGIIRSGNEFLYVVMPVNLQ